jgi:hypothetical protein
MEVRTLIKRGADHLVYCEDDLFTFNDGTTYVGAVFDGCSSGIKSHFASTLYSKLVKKALTPSLLKQDSISHINYSLFFHLAIELKEIKQKLMLDELELLSTAIIAVIREDKASVIVSGDGVIIHEGKPIIIESEGNAPDYLAYHFDNLAKAGESFKFYDFDLEDKGLSICTDGMMSFRNPDPFAHMPRVSDFLLRDESLKTSEAMLGRKYNMLAKEGYTNYDDVSIVRFMP